LETNPALVPQLVRKSIQSIACELLRELLPYVEFSDDELVTFRADIQKIDNDAGFERAFIGERAVSVSIFLDPASAGENDGGAVGILGARNDDLLLYLRVMEDNLDAIRKPWPRKLDDLRAVEEELNAYDSTISNIRYIMTMLLTPALGSTVAEAYAEGEANSRATDAALAVERFRRKTGRLPEKLDELVPEFLDEVPLDPFDGKPLRYSVREDAYVIHSIGPDRVDDGGQIVEEENEYGNDIDNPDIIFLVKRTKK